MAAEKWFPTARRSFDSLEDEQRHRKERLAAGFRLFAKFGFEEGVAGHITARDPIEPGHLLGEPVRRAVRARVGELA